MDLDDKADIREKSLEVKTSFVNCIRLGCDLARLATNTDLLATCKTTTNALVQFQRFVEGITRPYILHKDKIQHWCDALSKLVKRLCMPLFDLTPVSDPQKEALSLFKRSLEKVSRALGMLETWILTDPASYQLYHLEPSILDDVDPPHEVLQSDYSAIPRWILKQLCVARGMLVVAKEKEDQRMKKETSLLRSQINEALKQCQEKDLQLRLKEQAIAQQTAKMTGQTEKAIKFHKTIIEDQARTIAKLKSEIAELTQSEPAEEEHDHDQARRSRMYNLKEIVQEREGTIGSLHHKLHTCHAEIDSLKNQLSLALAKLPDSPRKVLKRSTNVIEPNPTAYGPERTDDTTNNNMGPRILTDYTVASVWITPEDTRKCLGRLLLDPADEFAFVRVLEKCYPATGAESEALAKVILQLFQQQGRVMELLFCMIGIEVQRTVEVSQLFRGEEFPPRLIRAYTRLIGIPFAEAILGDLISEIADKGITLEIDPEATVFENFLKAEVESVVTLNSAKLQEYTQRFLAAITSSLPQMPVEFIHILKHTIKRAQTKFPGSRHTVIAGFIFLRFFCPCIASPESFKLQQKAPISIPVRRTLLLISKCLQCLANGQKTFKEDCLNKAMGPFLDKNAVLLLDYTDRIDQWPPPIWGSAPYMATLQSLVTAKKAKILEVLETNRDNLQQKIWHQAVETPPLFRLVEVIKILQLEDRVRAPTDDRLRQRKNAVVMDCDELYEEWVSKRIKRSSFPTEKNNLLFKCLIDTFLDSDALVQAIIQTTIFQKDIASFLIYFLATIAEANNAIPFLMRNIIQTEVSLVYSETNFLKSGLSRELFIWYCKKWIGPMCLQAQWGRVLMTLINENKVLEIDPSKANPPLSSSDVAVSRKKLKSICFFLCESGLKSLERSPDCLRLFSTLLAQYTSQNIFQFFFTNLFSLAVYDPIGYKIIPKVDIPKNSLNALRHLAEMFRNIGNEAEFLFPNEALQKTEVSYFSQLFSNWTSAQDQPTPNPEQPEVAWNEEREAFIVALDHILENIVKIDEKLRFCGSIHHSLTFGSVPLISNLQSTTHPLPPKDQASKQTSQQSSPQPPPANNAKQGVDPPSNVTRNNNILASRIHGILDRLTPVSKDNDK